MVVVVYFKFHHEKQSARRPLRFTHFHHDVQSYYISEAIMNKYGFSERNDGIVILNEQTHCRYAMYDRVLNCTSIVAKRLPLRHIHRQGWY
jgi:hypothetical protein